MDQATEDILRLDRHSVWDWYLSNDLQIRIFCDFIVQCQRDKDTLYKYMYKKTLMFCSFTKTNTMNELYVYTKTHGLIGCSYISVK